MVSSGDVQDHISSHWSETPKGEAAQALAQHLGLNITENLGIGSMGEAFKTSDGRVIKITFDQSEYFTSKELVGREIPHVNTIHRCLQIKYRGIERFAIIQKFVSQEKRALLRQFENETCFHNSVQDFCYYTLSEESLYSNAEDLKEEYADNEEYLHLIDQYVKVALNLNYQVNYVGTDFFYRNSGWDEERQQIVAIDLGYSQSFTEEDEEILELK